MEKVKVNLSLQNTTKKKVEELHSVCGISRGSVIDILVARYGDDIKTILQKGEQSAIQSQAYRG